MDLLCEHNIIVVVGRRLRPVFRQVDFREIGPASRDFELSKGGFQVKTSRDSGI